MTNSVVFDVGGVLLDWNPERYLATAHPTLDTQRISEQVFRSETWRMLDAGRIARPEAQARFVAATGLSMGVITALLEGMPDSLLAIEPLQAFAHALHARGVPVYILSNMPEYVAMRLDARSALPEVFAERVFSYAERTLKPEPDIYRVLFERTGLAPEHCVFIDDSPENLRAAQAHGMRWVHMPDVSAETAATVIAQVDAIL